MSVKNKPVLKCCPFCGAIPTLYDCGNAVGNHDPECFLWGVLGNIPSYLQEKWNIRYDENGGNKTRNDINGRKT